MKHISKKQANTHKNSDSCIALEYPFEDAEINTAVVEIKGRYPDKGRVMNTKCKEIAYVSREICRWLYLVLPLGIRSSISMWIEI